MFNGGSNSSVQGDLLYELTYSEKVVEKLLLMLLNEPRYLDQSQGEIMTKVHLWLDKDGVKKPGYSKEKTDEN